MKKHLIIPLILFLLFMIRTDIFAQQNVGVGTVAPAFRLDVQGDPASILGTVINSKVNYVGTSDLRAIEGTSITNPGYGIGGRFTGGYKGIDALCSGGAYSASTLYGVYSNATGTAGTRVGIYGTASGGTSNYGVVGSVTGGTNYYGVYGVNSNLAGYAGYFDGRGLFLHDLRTNDDLFVDDNVGIGTISPAAKLHIIGGADAALDMNGFIQLGSASSWNLLLDDNEILARDNGAGNDLLIQNDDGNVLLCASKQGGVGIGLNSGTLFANGYLFSVDGKIIAEEMRIQNFVNWPDYVFADHYDLMPLEELKLSIETNNHLPKIPSAETVEQEGILVGEMQKMMMEKIEELTLYILDMHEVNKKQQAEIDKLKAVIGNGEP